METVDSIDAYKAKLAAAINANRGLDQGSPAVGGVPDLPPQDTQDIQQGAGPDIGPDDEDSINGAPGAAPMAQTIDGQDGAGPSIDAAPPPDAPQAAPAGGMGGGGGGPSIDGVTSQYFPNPLDSGQGGDSPRGTVPSAPTVPRGKTVKNVPRAPTVQNAPTAPTAPTIDGSPGAVMAPPGTQAAPPGAPVPVDGAPAAGPVGPIDGSPADVSPAAAHRNGETLPDGRPGLNVHPPGYDPTDPKNFKKGALQKLQAETSDPKPSQVFDAMTPKTQSSYMDWWEKQHGDIEDRYNQLHAQLGTRPDPQADPTRKDQFQMLMDFGVSLLKNSGRSSPYEMENGNRAVGTAAEDALGNQRARQQQRTSDYDKRNASLIDQKKEEDRDLGNFGQATREDSMIQTQQSRQRYYDDQLAKSGKPPTNQFRVDDKGNLRRWDPTLNNGAGGMGAVQDEKGQPVKEPIGTGVKGGRAGLGSGMIQQMDYLTRPQAQGGMGMSHQDAFNAVYHQKPSGNVTHDYVSVVNKLTPQNATPEEIDDARTQARQTIEGLYGKGALERNAANSQRTPVPSVSPPPQALASLKEGVHTKFGNGQTWTLSNGQPVRVQ